MTLRSNLRMLAMGAAAVVLVGVLSVNASAAGTYSAVPFSFVGTAAQCNPFPAGNKIVTASWLNGLGLPDNGTANPGGPTVHQGLLLSKNGPQSDCSAAGASIVGFAATGTLSALGFDYRTGGHCGGGAPRLNVKETPYNPYFFWFYNRTACPAPQHSATWTSRTHDTACAP